MSERRRPYPFDDFEPIWQERWDQTRAFRMPGPGDEGFDSAAPKFYALDMFPYAYARNNIWQGEITAQKGWSGFNGVGPAEKDFQDHQFLFVQPTPNKSLEMHFD